MHLQRERYASYWFFHQWKNPKPIYQLINNTHIGSHAIFNLHYIKTGILPHEYGRLYNQLQTMREESDYNCVYEVESEELKDRIEPARELIERIEKLISDKA